MKASSSPATTVQSHHHTHSQHMPMGLLQVDQPGTNSLADASPNVAYRHTDATTTTATTSSVHEQQQPQQPQVYSDQYADQHHAYHTATADEPEQHHPSSMTCPIDQDFKPETLQQSEPGHSTQYLTIAEHAPDTLPPPMSNACGLYYSSDFTSDGLPRYVLQSHDTPHESFTYYSSGPAPSTSSLATQQQHYANYICIPPPLQNSAICPTGPASQMMHSSQSSSSALSYASTGQIHGGYTSYAASHVKSHATSPVPPGSAGSGSGMPLHSPYDEDSSQSAAFQPEVGGVASMYPQGVAGLDLPHSGAGCPTDSPASTMMNSQGKKPLRITVKPPRRVITPSGLSLLTEVRAMRAAAAAAAAAGAKLARAERGQKLMTTSPNLGHANSNAGCSDGAFSAKSIHSDSQHHTSNEDNDTERSHEHSFNSSSLVSDTSGTTAASTDDSFTVPRGPCNPISIRRPAVPRPRYPWTSHDDDMLRNTMHATMGRSWPEIARKAFPDGRHGKDDCTERWRIISKPKAHKGPWTAEEDTMLIRLAEELGPEKWVIISSKMGTRTGKQCRERWHNHLDPAIKPGPFTPQEDEIIFNLYGQLGAKWSEIAKHLPGRPDNHVKNHFNTSLQRQKRRIRQQHFEEAIIASGGAIPGISFDSNAIAAAIAAARLTSPSLAASMGSTQQKSLSPASPNTSVLPSPRYAPYLSAATITSATSTNGCTSFAPPSPPVVPITPIIAASTTSNDRERYQRSHGFGSYGVSYGVSCPSMQRFPWGDHRLPPMTHIHQQQYQAESAANVLNTMYTLNAERYHTLMMQQQQQTQGRAVTGLGIDGTGHPSLAGLPVAELGASRLSSNDVGILGGTVSFHGKGSPSDIPDLSNTPSTGCTSGQTGVSPAEFPHPVPQDQPHLASIAEAGKVYAHAKDVNASAYRVSNTRGVSEQLDYDATEVHLKQHPLQAVTSISAPMIHPSAVTHGNELPRSCCDQHLRQCLDTELQVTQYDTSRTPITPLAGINLAQTSVVPSSENEPAWNTQKTASPLLPDEVFGQQHAHTANERVVNGTAVPRGCDEVAASVSARKTFSVSANCVRRGSVASATRSNVPSQYKRTLSAERGTARTIEKQVIKESLAMAQGIPITSVARLNCWKDDEEIEEPDDDKDEDYHE